MLIEKFALLMDMVEYDFEVSVESINGCNSYWVPTPEHEREECENSGIIDIGDDQSEFQKLISLIHEVGHVIFYHDPARFKEHRRIILFEESLAWYLGYDYALSYGIQVNLKEYTKCVEEALQLYKEMK
jgi:hypothetical protein